MDHVKNAQSCVNRVNAHRGTYGGTYENRSSFSTCLQDPKSFILIWDMARRMASLRFGVILSVLPKEQELIPEY